MPLPCSAAIAVPSALALGNLRLVPRAVWCQTLAVPGGGAKGICPALGPPRRGRQAWSRRLHIDCSEPVTPSASELGLPSRTAAIRASEVDQLRLRCVIEARTQRDARSMLLCLSRLSFRL